MAKAFSIASWNVEHFKQDPTRVDRVIDFVAAQNPDMDQSNDRGGKRQVDQRPLGS